MLKSSFKKVRSYEDQDAGKHKILKMKGQTAVS